MACRFLLVSGSLRAGSTNAAVVRTACGLLPPTVEGVIYEWRERVVALRVPDEPEARLGAVVALGSALGAAKRTLAEAA